MRYSDSPNDPFSALSALNDPFSALNAPNEAFAYPGAARGPYALNDSLRYLSALNDSFSTLNHTNAALARAHAPRALATDRSARPRSGPATAALRPRWVRNQCGIGYLWRNKCHIGYTKVHCGQWVVG
ncbi:hypothetical protein GCM10022247_24630 [Allokutzneria multivorans]|uniref:Uncharacterized protein n=1 Tax=Allokutzneria multivorans TaxID=1142134 RepID=A0ABP7RW45_9PSEU